MGSVDHPLPERGLCPDPGADNHENVGVGVVKAATGFVGPASEDRGYQHLQPLLIAHAAMTDDDPRRAPLRDHLVTSFLPVARHIALRYRNKGESSDDLFQVACIGLLHAITRYEPERGYPFLGFAIPTITGEIRRHFRDKTWSMRVPRRLKDDHVSIRAVTGQLSAQLGRAPRPSEIAARLGISVEDVLEALRAGESYQAGSLDDILGSGTNGTSRLDQLGDVDPALELFINTHSLAPALAALPERERAILIMRFYQDMSQTQIAERIGVSQMQISRLLAATLARLREAMEAEPTR